MADRKGQGSFAEFVKGAASAEEAAATVRLTGEVLRSSTEGKFILATPDRGPLELDVDAVSAFDVVEDSASRKVAQVVVAGDRLTDVKPVIADKSVIADKPAIADKPVWWDGTIPKPLLDPPPKAILDPPKVIADPPNKVAMDPQPDPRQVLFDPAVATRAAAAGAMPFVMATPHHAPAEALQAQAMAAGVAQTKQISQEGVGRTAEVRTVLAKDVVTDPGTDVLVNQTLTFKDVATDPSADWKMPIKDVRTDNITDVQKLPIKDAVGDPNTGVADTLMEGIDTMAEGGNTLAEGVEIPGRNFGPQF
jgi:hypothetical protein